MKRLATLVAALAAAPALIAAAPAIAVPPASIRIASPGPVLHDAVYDLTIAGFAPRRATAYLFVDYAGCATTLAGELRRVPHAYDSYSVSGTFAEVSGWKSSSAGTDHACAYLVTRRATVLGSARIPFVIR